MDRRRYRALLAVSATALVAIVSIVIAAGPNGDEVPLPAPLEAVFPLPGDVVVRQTAIEVDLPVGYSLHLEVDGVAIPSTEIGFIEATGQYMWQPGPTSLFAVWDGGEHSVTIHWDRTIGRPDPGSYSWGFRVT